MSRTNNRISRENMFIEILQTISKRSTCPRKQVGAILVKENRVIAMGYNGVLPGVKPEEGIDHITGVSKTVHAEANIISFCAKHGIATADSELYITLSPCVKCAELIVQAGINKVNYIEQYRDTSGLELLTKQNIQICQVSLK
ncbi:MAG: CMP deaminase [Alteromonas sp.]|nr:CMP deaminase [Alteromonas sp.]|tara:strand:- start:12315 stop:12743 length:429 start_codon:yes stop_codon:yes gene_type:complete